MSDSEIDTLVILGHILKDILETSDDIHNGAYVALHDDVLTIDGKIRLTPVQAHVLHYILPKV